MQSTVRVRRGARSRRRSTRRWRVGSLCSGYGGLDLGLIAALGGADRAEVLWHCEIEAAPARILEHHWPGVQNLGDLKKIQWSAVRRIDVLTAGYPCQPFSHAGKRRGTEDPRHLWPYILQGIQHLRPRFVVLENVMGHLTKGGTEVVRTLAAVGYDVRWGLVLAADAGAPHKRARLFIVAQDTTYDDALAPVGAVTDPGPSAPPASPDLWDADAPLMPTPRAARGASTTELAYLLGGKRDDADRPQGRVLFPSPRASDGPNGGPNQRGSKGDWALPAIEHLLTEGGVVPLMPTPAVNDMGEGKTPERWAELTTAWKAKHGNGNGHGKSLAIEVQGFATPTAALGDLRGAMHPDLRRAAGHTPTLSDQIVHLPVEPEEPTERVVHLPTPTTNASKGAWSQGRAGGLNLQTAVARSLPTPTARDYKGPNIRDDDTCLHGAITHNTSRPRLRIVSGLPRTTHLLPTPTCEPTTGNGHARNLGAEARVAEQRWGIYTAGIERWSALLRPVPSPTVVGAKGGRVLSPLFVEWMMGLPEGHVTSLEIGLSRRDQLKALGNGVVPQQAALALRVLGIRPLSH